MLELKERVLKTGSERADKYTTNRYSTENIQLSTSYVSKETKI